MKKLFSAILTVFLVLGLGTPGFSGDAVDIARLVQEAPTLDTYGDVPGVIWQRRETYSLLSDGSMEKTSLWVVMLTEKAERTWPERILTVPSFGELHVDESDLYDPVSGKKTRSLPWTVEDQGGVKKCVMDLGELDESVLVLRFRQIYEKRFSVEGLIELQSDLPLWEGVFSVDFPSGSELFFKSSKMGSPKIDKSHGKTVYTWTVYNVSERRAPSLVQGNEAYLAFSLKSGKVPYLQYLSRLDKIPVPALPGRFSNLLSMGDKTKAGKKLMKALDQDVLKEGARVLRDPVPDDGPWTEAERALVLNSWLKELTWRSRVLWTAYLPIDEASPAFMENLGSPVLKVAPPGSEPWFFVPGQTVEPGEDPSGLLGRTFYGGSPEEGLLTFSLDKGKAEDHRLTLQWDLDLDSQGALYGTLSLWVRKGWVGLFPSPENLSARSMEDVIPGIGSWIDGKSSVKPLDYGCRIDLPVKKLLGIPGGPGMLLRLPCLMAGSVLDLLKVQVPSELLFPFVLEQKYRIKLPKGLVPMSIPAMSDRSGGGLKFSEDLKYRKKQSCLEGEEKLVSLGFSADDSFVMALNRMVGAWSHWGEMSIPLAFSNIK